MSSPDLVPAPLIESRIYLIRGYKVLLDADLAQLYAIETKALNRAVKRNPLRFPEDCLFQLTPEEAAEILRYQIGTSSSESGSRYGGRRYRPYAFTELGIAMLSSVLNTGKAIQTNMVILRTFIRLRHILATHEELARQLDELRWRQDEHGQQIHAIFEVIQKLTENPEIEPKRRIGFPAPSQAAGDEPEHS